LLHIPPLRTSFLQVRAACCDNHAESLKIDNIPSRAAALTSAVKNEARLIIRRCRLIRPGAEVPSSHFRNANTAQFSAEFDSSLRLLHYQFVILILTCKLCQSLRCYYSLLVLVFYSCDDLDTILGVSSLQLIKVQSPWSYDYIFRAR